jgi:hypothetical protein
VAHRWVTSHTVAVTVVTTADADADADAATSFQPLLLPAAPPHLMGASARVRIQCFGIVRAGVGIDSHGNDNNDGGGDRLARPVLIGAADCDVPADDDAIDMVDGDNGATGGVNDSGGVAVPLVPLRCDSNRNGDAGCVRVLLRPYRRMLDATAPLLHRLISPQQPHLCRALALLACRVRLPSLAALPRAYRHCRVGSDFSDADSETDDDDCVDNSGGGGGARVQLEIYRGKAPPRLVHTTEFVDVGDAINGNAAFTFAVTAAALCIDGDAATPLTLKVVALPLTNPYTLPPPSSSSSLSSSLASSSSASAANNGNDTVLRGFGGATTTRERVPTTSTTAMATDGVVEQQHMWSVAAADVAAILVGQTETTLQALLLCCRDRMRTDDTAATPPSRLPLQLSSAVATSTQATVASVSVNAARLLIDLRDLRSVRAAGA